MGETSRKRDRGFARDYVPGCASVRGVVEKRPPDPPTTVDRRWPCSADLTPHNERAWTALGAPDGAPSALAIGARLSLPPAPRGAVDPGPPPDRPVPAPASGGCSPVDDTGGGTPAPRPRGHRQVDRLTGLHRDYLTSGRGVRVGHRRAPGDVQRGSIPACPPAGRHASRADTMERSWPGTIVKVCT
jgi:hypothetical protein